MPFPFRGVGLLSDLRHPAVSSGSVINEPSEVLSPRKAKEAQYQDRVGRALARRAAAQETVSGLLTAIETQDRSNWFANKFHSALEAAESLDLPQVVINGLNKYVAWLNENEKAGERDLNRLDREELVERRELLMAHLRQENPELLKALIGLQPRPDVDEDSGVVPDAVDTSQTEGV